MYETDLHEMSHDQLLETLSSLRRTWETRPWRVEEAALVAEIRQELILRGSVDPSVDDLLHDLSLISAKEPTTRTTEPGKPPAARARQRPVEGTVAQARGATTGRAP